MGEGAPAVRRPLAGDEAAAHALREWSPTAHQNEYRTPRFSAAVRLAVPAFAEYAGLPGLAAALEPEVVPVVGDVPDLTNLTTSRPSAWPRSRIE